VPASKYEPQHSFIFLSHLNRISKSLLDKAFFFYRKCTGTGGAASGQHSCGWGYYWPSGRSVSCYIGTPSGSCTPLTLRVLSAPPPNCL